MTRLGINPSRHKTSRYHPAEVTVCILTYIPHLEGYFRQRLEVVDLTISSLIANTSPPYDLLIFDNGSCPETVDYLQGLQRSGQIRYLILSEENIGKISALGRMFRFAPGRIVAYTDDDIYFYPGWLEAQLKILKAFPNAGMVSGVPVRNASTYALNAPRLALEGKLEGVSAGFERRIPDTWEADWALSTGREPTTHLEAFKDHQDLVLRSGSTEAIAGANHFQFAGYTDRILSALPGVWVDRLMGHMVEIDNAIDSMGYLRLSTTNRFTRHLGNIIGSDLEGEIPMLREKSKLGSPPLPDRRVHWLARLPGGRRLALAIYDRLFNIIHDID